MLKRILVVEDEKDINELVTLNLRILGYEVVSCHDGLEGFELATCQEFDLILLDVMLPGINGLEFCRRFRAQENCTAILMLTAKNTEADRVIGLEVGADDYLTKPFSVLELQARVKAILRRIAMISSRITSLNDESTQTHFHGGLVIDKQKRAVTVRDEEMNLTAKEFDLLLYLASYPGRVFNRDQLLDAVWGYKHSGYEHTVNSHINRLRAKLESNPSNPQYVLTVWGVGYKFKDA